MNIVEHKIGEAGTVLFSDNGDGTRHAICIGVGLPEDWHGYWDMPADIDPVDLALALVDEGSEISDLDPFRGDFQANRAKVIAGVNANRGKHTWPSDKATTQDMKASCLLPPGLTDQARERAKERGQWYRANPEREKSKAQVFAERIRIEDQMAADAKRRKEELLADDILATSGEARRALRNNTSANVGLSVKFV